MQPSPNPLLSRLLRMTPEAKEHLERVVLSPGPWTNPDGADEAGHLYFPEAGLMAVLGPGLPGSHMGLALLGCHACWRCGDGHMSPLSLHVVRAGHAQRIGWAVLQAQPQRYAPWLLQSAAASQQLIHQMAHMTFCAQNHPTLQRLASGLMVVLNQNPNSGAALTLTLLAHWLACQEEALHDAAQTLQAHGALQLAKDEAGGTVLHSLQPQALARLACACHLSVAQQLG